MESAKFFSWCSSNGFKDNSQLASLLDVSPQTIRNWRKRDDVPYWLTLFITYYENAKSKQAGVDSIVSLEDMSFSDLKEWQRKNSIKTYQQTADVFAIKRQAVHQWFRRGKLPAWLKFATLGYDLKITN